MGLKLVPPAGGLALEIMLKALDVLFNKESISERVTAMWELIKGEFAHIETTKASHDDVQRAIQLSFWYDRHERDDAKRARYVKLIGNALRSETPIQDVASFVQTIEQLNDRDVIVLRVLNAVMNKPGDWKPQANPGGDVMKVHPKTFIQRAQELAVLCRARRTLACLPLKRGSAWPEDVFSNLNHSRREIGGGLAHGKMSSWTESSYESERE